MNLTQPTVRVEDFFALVARLTWFCFVFGLDLDKYNFSNMSLECDFGSISYIFLLSSYIP